jgi:hypothetical protein
MKRLRSSILRKYAGQIHPDHFVWAIDDTANPKYSKDAYRAGHWHGSSGPWYGQKIMVLALVDMNRGIAIPISYIVVPKKGDADYKKGADLAIDLLKSALDENFPKLPVVFDSWFDSVELMKNVENLGMVYVGEIKTNRKVRKNPGRYVAWSSTKALFSRIPRYRVRSRFDSEKIKKGKKRAKVAAQLRIWVRGRKSQLNAIGVFNRRNGRDAFGYYVSTDLSMSRARIWEISRARWKIEVMFRDLKQHLSFGKMPSGSQNAADISICLPMLILVSLRLHSESLWKHPPDDTIGNMVDQIREQSLSRSIDYIVQRENEETLNRLRSRRLPSRMNKKPVDQLAEAS